MAQADGRTNDYIIVGAGSSGCVLANRLSANPDTTVILLEAGGPDTDPKIHDPRDMPALLGTALDWMYWTEKQEYLNQRKILLNRGKVLGGCSSVNAMIYIRGNRLDFDHWNYLGNQGWSYEQLLPFFRKSEDNENGRSRFHGADGPLSVVNNRNPTPAAQAFVRAAGELGFCAGNWDFNAEQQENGAGLYQYTITRDGKRCSTAVAFLHPVFQRSNLRLRTGVQVTRVLLEDYRAVGVEYLQDGQRVQLRAQREVIVSAGSIDSPKLLLLSGIGSADALRSAGIPAKVHLPGVGANLWDHVALPVLFSSKQPPPQPATVAEAGLFVRTRRALERASPDLQYHFQAGIPTGNPAQPLDGGKIVFGAVLCTPLSRGYVRVRSANPADPPVVQPNYLACEVEMLAHLEGIKLTRDLAHTRSFHDFVDQELAPGASKTELELRDYVRSNATTIWHPGGTCKMGYDNTAVVDPQLRVHGVDGMRVADASVMPGTVAGNINAACIMIGEKAADLILSNN
jgi:choline dehydrogenase